MRIGSEFARGMFAGLVGLCSRSLAFSLNLTFSPGRKNMGEDEMLGCAHGA